MARFNPLLALNTQAKRNQLFSTYGLTSNKIRNRATSLGYNSSAGKAITVGARSTNTTNQNLLEINSSHPYGANPLSDGTNILT